MLISVSSPGTLTGKMGKLITFIVLSVALNGWLAAANDDSSELGVVPGRKSTNCSCGWANKEDQRIINGVETKINEYPLMAALVNPKLLNIMFCGGSIITPYHVLTAAHCTVKFTSAGKPIAVVVGEHSDLLKTETNVTEVIPVKEVIEHENYNRLSQQNDIALLVLEREITFSKWVGPVCLPTGPIDLSGQKIRVMGWGRTNADGGTSDVLLKVDLDVQPIELCAKKYSVKIPTNPPNQLCTFTPTKDSCKGDSGGPLIWLDPQTNRYVQVALVSFGESCGKTKPGVNTLVSAFLDWIHRKIHESHPAPTCS